MFAYSFSTRMTDCAGTIYWERAWALDVAFDAANIDPSLRQIGWQCRHLSRESQVTQRWVLALEPSCDCVDNLRRCGAHRIGFVSSAPVSPILSPYRQDMQFVPIDFDAHVLRAVTGDALIAARRAAPSPYLVLSETSAADSAPHNLGPFDHFRL